MLTLKWFAFASLCLAAVHTLEAKITGHTTWFPSLRLLFKHSDHVLAEYLSEVSGRAFNHDHVGVTALAPPVHHQPTVTAVPHGYRVNARRQLLGTGQNVRECTAGAHRKSCDPSSPII